MAKSALNRSILAYLMIPKGNQRGGGQQLAAHLQNSFDNDSVEIADLRGAVAPDLAGAFAEWFAESKATKCTKYLYSLSLNPDPAQKQLTREQYMDFIARAEERMGLEGQPRAIVFHVKYGREHCHVVWSRIDTEKMRAVQMPKDHQKLRLIAQEFARDHGIELPDGMKKDRGKDRYEGQKENVNLAEKQQEERSGLTKAARMRDITAAWSATKTGEEFIRALTAKDFYLARGDRRDYVVVDVAGEIHSLARQIRGAKRADIRERLSALPPEKLPGVEQAQAHAAEVRAHRRERLENAASPEGPTPDERRAFLQQQQRLRRLALEAERDALNMRQAKEAGHLTLMQAALKAGIDVQRQQSNSGVVGFLKRITGIGLIIDYKNRNHDRALDRTQKVEGEALARRHDSEQRDLKRRERAIQRIDRRETKALEIAITRADLQRIIGPAKTHEQGGKETGRPPDKFEPVLTPEQAQLRAQFDAAARGAKPKAPTPAKKTRGLTGLFNRASANRDAENARKAEAEKGTPDKTEDPTFEKSEEERERLRTAFEAAARARETEPAKAPEPTARSGSLADEFRRRAADKDRGLDDPEPGQEKNHRKTVTDYTVRR